jgi:hypothetical protein
MQSLAFPAIVVDEVARAVADCPTMPIGDIIDMLKTKGISAASANQVRSSLRLKAPISLDSVDSSSETGTPTSGAVSSPLVLVRGFDANSFCT